MRDHGRFPACPEQERRGCARVIMFSMATSALVSVEEYLSTVYEPECDYVDGVLEERNVGEQDHSRLQTLLIAFLAGLEKKLGIRVFADQRVQVKPSRFRVPDICVTVGPKPEEQIFTKPPFLCIEILSPEDRMVRLERKIDDYLEMGVRYVWVVSPQNRKGWIYTVEGACEAKDGFLRTSNPDIAVPLPELFAEM